jgi:hypothetical protein
MGASGQAARSWATLDQPHRIVGAAGGGAVRPDQEAGALLRSFAEQFVVEAVGQVVASQIPTGWLQAAHN